MATLTLSISDAVLVGLNQRAQAENKTVEQLVMPTLAVMAQTDGVPPNETFEEWRTRVHAWIDSHPKRKIVIDDDRDTIYGGPDGRGTW